MQNLTDKKLGEVIAIAPTIEHIRSAFHDPLAGIVDIELLGPTGDGEIMARVTVTSKWSECCVICDTEFSPAVTVLGLAIVGIDDPDQFGVICRDCVVRFDADRAGQLLINTN